MIAPDLINGLAQASAERLVDSLIEGTALAAFAWALLRALPRQSAATRFAIWFSALLGAAVLPILSAGRTSSALASSQSVVTLPSSWATYLFLAWIAAAFILLARFSYGLLELRRLRSRCRELPLAELPAEARETVLRSSRPALLLISEDVQVPTAIGFFHPAVVLPAGLVDDLSPAELQHVLLHELAHLSRWDDWSNIALQLVKAILCFHPAVWWVEQRMALEREMACDDAVLAATGSARAYAECLARLAEKSFLRRTAALAHAAVSRVRQTTLRVARILDGGSRRAFPPRRWAMSLVGSFAVLCVVTAWHAPRLISFREAPAPAIAVATPPAPSVQALLAGKSYGPHVIMARASQPAPAPKAPVARHAVAHPRTVHAVAAHMIRAKAEAPGRVQSVVLVYYEGQTLDNGTVVWRMTVWHVSTQPPVRKTT